MDHSNVTVTLPMTEHGFVVILTALGIGVGSWVVWLVMKEQERKTARAPLAVLIAFAWCMLPVWLAIFSGTLWQVWLMLSGASSALGSGPSLGMGALLAALLGAPFLVWGTVLKQRTVDFQQEGHITDRITAAVEQLGAEKTVKKIVDGQTQETSEPNIEVRIGAILSLERIAQDSTRYDKGRDHVRVMEILCAYVRENSNARPPRDFPLPEWEPLADDATEEARAAHEAWREARFADRDRNNAHEWAQSLPKPRADIAVALQVLGRRTAEQRLVEAAWPEAPQAATVWPFDTPCPELRKGTMDDAPLSRAEIAAFTQKLEAWKSALCFYSGYRLDLRGANLQRADLSAKRLDAADAVFSGAALAGARMEGAHLMGARLEGTDFLGARMEGAILIETRMEGADFYKARMEGATLVFARMAGAVLLEALMQGGGNFSYARMDGAEFSKARMEGADLTDATFEGASLKDVDCSDVKITAEQVKSTFGDASVILPEGVDRPAHWPDWELPFIGDNSFDTEWRKWQADPEGYVPPQKPDD